MKKSYSKPEIMFESFSVATNIASCGIRIYGPSQGNCGYAYEEEHLGTVVIFIYEATGCAYKQEDGYNDICYHTFDGNDILFNS